MRVPVRVMSGVAAMTLAAVSAAPAQPMNWSGFYVGAHAGWGQSPTTIYDPNIPQWSFSQTPSGMIGGAQAGYNFQRDAWVWGAEGDFSASNIAGSGVDDHPPIGPNTFAGDIYESRVKWLATLTGRLGYTWGQSLLYAKAGAAWSKSELHFQYVQIPGFMPTSLQSTRQGWTAGGGFEYLFAAGWSAKIEYDYADFGHSGPVTFEPLPDGFVATFKQRLHLIKAGLNFQFGR